MIAENRKFSQMFKTPFIGIQFDVNNNFQVYALEALLKYEAGFPDGILANVKEVEHIRIVVVSGTDGFRCKYFLTKTVYIRIYTVFVVPTCFSNFIDSKDDSDFNFGESGYKIWSDLHSPRGMHCCK